MKEIKRTKKVGLIKKLLIKICRILGYELFDQTTLQFVLSNQSFKDSISVPGEKSFTLGLGLTSITRKIQNLDIIIKTCTKVQLVSQNKKRIFEKQKLDYSIKTIKSLYNSARELKKTYKDININFTIIDAGSPGEDLKKINILNKNNEFKVKLININILDAINKSKVLNKNNKEIENNMATTMASIRESFSIARECNDLIYFVEDDYLHKSESLTEMVHSYEKFASIFKNEVFLLSTDYPYLYKKIDNSKILIGNAYHWRTVNESLLTFMTSKKMINKHYSKLIEMATNENNPFEKNLHQINEKEKCLSPIPSLSIHCTNVNSVFGLSPNINVKKIWSENE